MTTDLEKKFFETFGVEKIIPCYKCSMQNTNWDCKRTCLYDDEKRTEYPQITDTHYLQLLCLFTKEMNCFTVYDEDVNGLKEAILKDFILDNGYFSKQQVQELFKEN